MNIRKPLCLVLLLGAFAVNVDGQSVAGLSGRFWQWRAQEQPFTNDDIPRIERPSGFTVDWSPQAIQQRLKRLAEFEEEWKRIAPSAQSPVPEQVDYRLLGSALARVRWELTVVKDWQRDPVFYVDQTLGSVFVLLLPPAPFSEERQQEIIARFQQIPATVRDAEANLTDMRKPFVQLGVDALDDVAERVKRTEDGLVSQFSEKNFKALHEAVTLAVAALQQYRGWLEAALPSARTETAIGRDSYVYFLRNVALLPYTPEQLLAMGSQERSRSVAFEAYQEERLAGKPAAPIFPSASEQMKAEREDEEKVRAFLVENKILTVPASMKHYHNLLLPTYLEPLEDLGVTDDLTGPSRLQEDGISYIRKPSPDLGFFHLSTARDPRPIIVHEGVPGHYFQLCLSWSHPDPIRRHYYDSGANEGIGFYAEELMLQAGLFDDNPHTRETIYSFMRLRALRVEVDVKLALGEFTLQQAADYLAATVPMDKKTALAEAAMFASTPGQAISYQVGKLQIMDLLADAKREQAKSFSMLKFNDSVWLNGNVPIALQRWEMLGDAKDVPTPSSLDKAQ